MKPGYHLATFDVSMDVSGPALCSMYEPVNNHMSVLGDLTSGPDGRDTPFEQVFDSGAVAAVRFAP